MLRTGYTEKLL